MHAVFSLQTNKSRLYSNKNEKKKNEEEIIFAYIVCILTQIGDNKISIHLKCIVNTTAHATELCRTHRNFKGKKLVYSLQVKERDLFNQDVNDLYTR